MLYGRGQAAENLHVSWVTGELFALLGVRPALGRLIGPEDDDLAATPVAVIGDGYGRRRFGRAREALGATVSFDDVTYVIVGVLPPGFSGPDPSAADVWLPLQIATPASLAARGKSPAAFDRRCIPPICVVHRSNTAGIFPLLALLSGRIANLGATRGSTTGC